MEDYCSQVTIMELWMNYRLQLTCQIKELWIIAESGIMAKQLNLRNYGLVRCRLRIIDKDYS